MATESKTAIFYINLGGTVANAGAFRYAWRAKTGSYDNIDKALGVVKAKDTDKGLIFGANRPNPTRVRINCAGSKVAYRWCEPDKVSSVTTGGTLNGKKIKINGTQYNIDSVEQVNG